MSYNRLAGSPASRPPTGSLSTRPGHAPNPNDLSAGVRSVPSAQGAEERVKRLIKSTVAGECLFYIIANLRRRIRKPILESTITAAEFEGERLRLLRHVNTLLPHAGIEVADNCLAGKRVLVIGVGSTFGFALLLHALGAETVVTIDPFLRDTPRAIEKEFKAYLTEAMPWDEARERAKAYLAERDQASSRDGSGQKNISYLVHDRRIKFRECGVEEATTVLHDEPRFDLILSNAVLEHLRDLDVAMRQFKELLAPDGAMAHEFGFMSHGFFTQMHSQKYLTFSPRVWSLMTKFGAPPNRLSLSHFRRALERAGLTNVELEVKSRYSDEEAEYAMRYAHPSVRADNRDDMSAFITVMRLRPSMAKA